MTKSISKLNEYTVQPMNTRFDDEIC